MLEGHILNCFLEVYLCEIRIMQFTQYIHNNVVQNKMTLKTAWPIHWCFELAIGTPYLPSHRWATEIILCMRPANERWRYTVALSLIGWVHTQNDPWSYRVFIVRISRENEL